jgi:hypothetical protein
LAPGVSTIVAFDGKRALLACESHVASLPWWVAGPEALDRSGPGQHVALKAQGRPLRCDRPSVA